MAIPLACLLALAATASYPQSYPGKPIRLIVPWPPAGYTLVVDNITGHAINATLQPKMPTVAESGLPGFEASIWFGLMAPAATPPEIVARLNAEAGKALQAPDMREKLVALGFEIQSSTPQEFTALLKSETEKWAKVAKASGARAE